MKTVKVLLDEKFRLIDLITQPDYESGYEDDGPDIRLKHQDIPMNHVSNEVHLFNPGEGREQYDHSEAMAHAMSKHIELPHIEKAAFVHGSNVTEAPAIVYAHVPYHHYTGQAGDVIEFPRKFRAWKTHEAAMRNIPVSRSSVVDPDRKEGNYGDAHIEPREYVNPEQLVAIHLPAGHKIEHLSDDEIGLSRGSFLHGGSHRRYHPLDDGYNRLFDYDHVSPVPKA